MNLPITNYEITLRDIVDSLIGIIVIIFGVIGCVIFTNIIMNLFLSNTKTMNDITTIVFVLFINIVIIFYLDGKVKLLGYFEVNLKISFFIQPLYTVKVCKAMIK
jgi:uncharacterized membrane protein